MPLEHYQIIGKLGAGKYSSVYQVKRLTDSQMFALKKVTVSKMEPKAKKNAINEVKLLSLIKHPNVVGLIEVFYDEFIDSLCLILELAEHGDLNDKIQQYRQKRKKMAEQQVWKIIEQISLGLHFMHSNNILHRDIKASNILLFRNQIVKIGDLNVSTYSQGLSSTRTGTLSYASPQIWKGESYDCKTDIWSMGCLVYELMCFRRPFEDESMEQVYKKIIKCQYQKISEDYSKQLRDLITFMLQLNPKLRPSSFTIYKLSLGRGKLLNKYSSNSKLTPLISSKKQFIDYRINCTDDPKIMELQKPISVYLNPEIKRSSKPKLLRPVFKLQQNKLKVACFNAKQQPNSNRQTNRVYRTKTQLYEENIVSQPGLQKYSQPDQVMKQSTVSPLKKYCRPNKLHSLKRRNTQI